MHYKAGRPDTQRGTGVIQNRPSCSSEEGLQHHTGLHVTVPCVLPLQQSDKVRPLGADHPHLHNTIEPIRLGPPGGPAAISTRLGWTLQGPTKLVQKSLSHQHCLFTTVSPPTTELMKNMQRLWEMNVMPLRSDKLVSIRGQRGYRATGDKNTCMKVEGILRYATLLLRKRNIPPLSNNQGGGHVKPKEYRKEAGTLWRSRSWLRSSAQTSQQKVNHGSSLIIL